MKRSFLFLLLQFPLIVLAQDKKYAHQIIDTLASPSMHGRGYVFGGDKIAAKYIADQFRGFGLLSLEKSGSYYQEFSFPVNTFPGKVEMTFYKKDGQKEKCFPGANFLVRPESPSVKGHFAVVVLDSAIIYDPSKFENFKKLVLKKSFVLVDTTGVRTKEKLNYMTNFVKYPTGVKGILLPLKHNEIEGAGGCSKLLPWDFSMMQSTTPIIEMDERHADITAIDICVEAKFLKKYNSQNVIGSIRGSVYPDSFVVFTAHYDHLGHMGRDVYFPGANDNASGVAMLLSLAKYYSQAEHKPRCTMVFMAFGAEEVGLLGSRYYTSHPFFPLRAIRFLINMDILGTGDEGIMVVNATINGPEFKKMQWLNDSAHYLPAVKPRGKAAISDHYFFTEARVPCFYIYTLGGIKAYHDTCDRRETLPLTEFEDLFSLLRDFANWEDAR
jgi:aminopeptidase YwaD